MTREEFARHQEELFEKLRALREAGQKEYAHEDSNAFRNFESIGKDFDLDRKIILWVYFKKHLDGILAHINGYVSQRESVHGRIQDAIVYLMLLDGMILEEENKVDAFRESNNFAALERESPLDISGPYKDSWRNE